MEFKTWDTKSEEMLNDLIIELDANEKEWSPSEVATRC